MTKPIPTKFHEGENAIIDLLAKRSGLSRSEVIRRCVRFLGAEIERRGPGWNWIAETAEIPTEKIVVSSPLRQEARRLGQQRRAEPAAKTDGESPRE